AQTPPASGVSPPVTTLGAPQAFDYAWLKGQARALATTPYQAPNIELPAALAKLDYDGFQSIRFKPDQALWAKDDLRFHVQFFHRGFLFKERVRIFEVVGGQAQEVAYLPEMFDLRKSGLDAKTLPRDLGFAGFRVQHQTDFGSDVAAFLGASYFRAVGADLQYGLSARGLAIDFGGMQGEEFPRFKSFWIERPGKDVGTLTVYALLDSPSITGAYRIALHPGGAMTMDVDAALYPRKTIERLGIAPLTSMYYVGENDRRMDNDWRPEIHDSDGLQVNTGLGEWIWRPLRNPSDIRLNSFLDENPRAFGLLQRDRDFDHYQDDGVFYDRRPNLWVMPKPIEGAGWGKGSVQLLELPAPDETHDNIVAAWVPDDKPQAGQELLYSYRLMWGTDIVAAPPLAHVIATRTGIGGIVGQKRKYFSWRFAIDFSGGALPTLLKRARAGRLAEVETVVTASRGTVEIVSARPQFEQNGYRAMFDLRPPEDSNDPIDVRVFLRLNGEALSETWIYQWLPPPKAERERLVREG
ncbi:MAG TPA: glucan biosynthesis protein D, partial [Burkholderiaceae bacterium]|nr:glucan biosynthesis protein D [Burkholderiaceae bacterium]